MANRNSKAVQQIKVALSVENMIVTCECVKREVGYVVKAFLTFHKAYRSELKRIKKYVQYTLSTF